MAQAYLMRTFHLLLTGASSPHPGWPLPTRSCAGPANVRQGLVSSEEELPSPTCWQTMASSVRHPRKDPLAL